MRRAYAYNLRMVLSELKPGDRLIIGYINSNSQEVLTLPVNIELPTYTESWFDNPEIDKREKRETLQYIADTLRFVEASVDSTIAVGRCSADRTDIIGSLKLTQRLFENYPDYEKILMINSDMREDDVWYNFDRKDLSNARVDRIIKELGQRGLIANLVGVKIYVAGASARTIRRYDEIKHFWSQYFRSAGANCSAADYGAALIRFDE
ncbi:MAG TPA: hypothetical protein VLX91_05910 [Candidatus Acidoferrales bacterium]|nr:hypothetical protein [Candidatus Acidoferrales bacterium]